MFIKTQRNASHAIRSNANSFTAYYITYSYIYSYIYLWGFFGLFSIWLYKSLTSLWRNMAHSSLNLDWATSFIWIRFTISLWTFWSSKGVIVWMVNGVTESLIKNILTLYFKSDDFMHSKKCWVFFNPILGQIWTNPNIRLKSYFKI